MLIQTILNRVQKFKSFVYRRVRWVGAGDHAELEVEVTERANGRPLCSGCGRARPGYDRLGSRRFEFVPLWGVKVFLVYAPRRVECSGCGVHVEQMPWAMGKSGLTQTYAWFLARWARRLSWREVAVVFGSSWERVFRSVEIVEAGGSLVEFNNISSFGEAYNEDVENAMWLEADYFDQMPRCELPERSDRPMPQDLTNS